MGNGPLLSRLRERTNLDREEGNIAYFLALSLELEYLTKLVSAGVIACVGDDIDRHRYSLEFSLVRADSLGDWVGILNTALTGPPAQFFVPGATHITRDLTERVGAGDWRYAAVQRVSQVAGVFGLDGQIGQKAALRQFFELGAAIRNRTRGHGATTSEQCGLTCQLLAEAIDLIYKRLELFQHDWAYLYRNLSGKFRVSPLLGACQGFSYLKKSRDELLPNGVFVDIGSPIHVRLLYGDPDLRDLLLPNGNYKAGTFESLSFVTNCVLRQDASTWSVPPGRLPPSETHGRSVLEQVGGTFANLPPTPTGHIARKSLEGQLREELLKSDRHPIVSLTGPGGIGKTTLALAVIRGICKRDPVPYDVILWMSARDIDLLAACRTDTSAER